MFSCWSHSNDCKYRKAFLQIAVPEKNGLYSIFVVPRWNCNNILTTKLTSYCICSILFGVTQSSFVLNATLQKHIMTYKHDDPYFTEVLKSLYADDLNAGASSVQDGYCFYT